MPVAEIVHSIRLTLAESTCIKTMQFTRDQECNLSEGMIGYLPSSR